MIVYYTENGLGKVTIPFRSSWKLEQAKEIIKFRIGYTKEECQFALKRVNAIYGHGVLKSRSYLFPNLEKK